jgi:hypothetical protein
MSNDFASTRAIWEWLLEKPEVNRVVQQESGKTVFLDKRGFPNTGDEFLHPAHWSKHVELPKVTIDRESLAKAWDSHVAEWRLTASSQSTQFDEFCKRLGL